MTLRFIGRTSLLLMAAYLGVGGCGLIQFSPPAEAILVGRWLLATTQPDFNPKTFVFDANGRLTEIREQTDATTTVVTRDVHKLTRVNGKNVRVEATLDDLIFEGTLNDDNTLMSGNLVKETTLIFTSTTVIKDLGAATLTKQP